MQAGLVPSEACGETLLRPLSWFLVAAEVPRLVEGILPAYVYSVFSWCICLCVFKCLLFISTPGRLGENHSHDLNFIQSSTKTFPPNKATFTATGGLGL